MAQMINVSLTLGLVNQGPDVDGEWFDQAIQQLKDDLDMNVLVAAGTTWMIGVEAMEVEGAGS